MSDKTLNDIISDIGPLPMQKQAVYRVRSGGLVCRGIEDGSLMRCCEYPVFRVPLHSRNKGTAIIFNSFYGSVFSECRQN